MGIQPSVLAARDSDSTPVFYSSKRLHVTGMRILVGSSTVPVSAVVRLEVLKRTVGYLIEVLKAGGVSLVLIVSSVIAGSGFRSISKLLAMASFAMFLIGLAGLVLVGYGIARFIWEKSLHIRLVSGDSLKVASFDKRAIWKMHSAVERALSYDKNRAAGTLSVADELEKLSALRRQGAISESDWARAKDLFLGKQPDAQEQAVKQLRQLFELRKNGVLSESEYNMKKWDVLARSETRSAYA